MDLTNLFAAREKKDRAPGPGPDGIIDFIGHDTERGTDAETLAYQQKYQSIREAEAYNGRYRNRKQRTTCREGAILRKLLQRYPVSETLLDLPAGGGRLSPVLGAVTRTLIEMDLSPGQLLYGQKHNQTAAKQIRVRASALAIPLRDNSIDGSVCIRLSHHLYSHDEKETLITELLRVSRRFTILYFADGNSPKYLMRRLRDRLRGRSRKINWMTQKQLKKIVQRHGGRVVDCPALGPLRPHRYALIEKALPHPSPCRHQPSETIFPLPGLAKPSHL